MDPLLTLKGEWPSSGIILIKEVAWEDKSRENGGEAQMGANIDGTAARNILKSDILICK